MIMLFLLVALAFGFASVTVLLWTQRRDKGFISPKLILHGKDRSTSNINRRVVNHHTHTHSHNHNQALPESGSKPSRRRIPFSAQSTKEDQPKSAITQRPASRKAFLFPPVQHETVIDLIPVRAHSRAANYTFATATPIANGQYPHSGYYSRPGSRLASRPNSMLSRPNSMLSNYSNYPGQGKRQPPPSSATPLPYISSGAEPSDAGLKRHLEEFTARAESRHQVVEKYQKELFAKAHTSSKKRSLSTISDEDRNVPVPILQHETNDSRSKKIVKVDDKRSPTPDIIEQGSSSEAPKTRKKKTKIIRIRRRIRSKGDEVEDQPPKDSVTNMQENQKPVTRQGTFGLSSLSDNEAEPCEKDTGTVKRKSAPEAISPEPKKPLMSETETQTETPQKNEPEKRLLSDVLAAHVAANKRSHPQGRVKILSYNPRSFHSPRTMKRAYACTSILSDHFESEVDRVTNELLQGKTPKVDVSIIKTPGSVGKRSLETNEKVEQILPLQETESKPSFTFGKGATSSETPAKFSFGNTVDDKKPSFSFGVDGGDKASQVPTNSEANPPSSVGTPSFTFGKDIGTKKSVTSSDTKAAESKPSFTFGAVSTTTTTDAAKPAFSFGDTKLPAAPSISFGVASATPTTTTTKAIKDTIKISESSENKTGDNSKPSFTFGVAATESKPQPFSFGQKTTVTSNAGSAQAPFSFGQATAATPIATTGNVSESKPAFSFGQANTATPIATTGNSSESKPAFSFGQSTNAKSTFSFSTNTSSSETTKPGGTFTFGKTPSTDVNPPVTELKTTETSTKPAFSFGASTSLSGPSFGAGTKPSTIEAVNPSLNFGQPSSQASTGFGVSSMIADSSNPVKPDSSFVFGASNNHQSQPSTNNNTSNGNASFTFGAAPQSMPSPFGQTASSSSGFTFGSNSNNSNQGFGISAPPNASVVSGGFNFGQTAAKIEVPPAGPFSASSNNQQMPQLTSTPSFTAIPAQFNAGAGAPVLFSAGSNNGGNGAGTPQAIAGRKKMVPRSRRR